MKLCSFNSGERTHLGVLTERGVVDLTDKGFGCDMNAVIESSAIALPLISELVKDSSLPALDPASLRFANVTRPGKIACVGLNYRSHAEETGGEAPKEPVIFSKFNDALCPAGTPVALPENLRCFDYESELVIVVGRRCWQVTEEAAPDYIFGYTVGNDLSARDCQFRSNQWLIGKSLPNFAPAGPFIATADSFDPAAPNKIRGFVNGACVQDDTTNGMIFSCASIVSYCSQFFTLEPGDLIFTGTPSGVILGHPKGSRVWLKRGDRVRVEIEGIGSLENELI